MKLSAKYKESLEKKWAMRFKTVHPDGDCYEGMVIDIKRSFVVIKAVTDFEFDGTIIFPKKSICGYRDGDFESCYNRILHNNRQIDKLLIPQWLQECESIREVVSKLMQNDIWPCVEVLLNKESTSRAAFFLGPVVETEKDGFLMDCYDAAGRWGKAYAIIKYNDLLRIEFDDRYSNHFNQYMRTHNKDSGTDAA